MVFDRGLLVVDCVRLDFAGLSLHKPLMRPNVGLNTTNSVSGRGVGISFSTSAIHTLCRCASRIRVPALSTKGGSLELADSDCILATSLWVSQNALPRCIYRYHTKDIPHGSILYCQSRDSSRSWLLGYYAHSLRPALFLTLRCC